MPPTVDADYATALEFLLGRIDFERTVPIPYGVREYKLDRMRELLARLGHPERGLRIVHVAGTKGKGSTSAMLSAVLTAAGYRTGLFTSPHLERVEERIAVDGRPISAEQFAKLVERVRPAVAEMDALPGMQGPTYFDLTTALALVHFAQVRAAWVVLEVGLGGRLDSTNVCQPAASVITSISLDHMRQLGDTPALIAREKAGIIKPGVPVICGVTEPEPREAIREVAREQAAPQIELEQQFAFQYRPALAVDRGGPGPSLDFESRVAGHERRLEDVRLGLLGRHQAHNAAVALATLEELQRQGTPIPEAAIRRGLAELRWPARVEIVATDPVVIVDAAHNLASAEALAQTLQESFVSRPRTLIFAATREKDAAGMLRVLLPRFDRAVLTQYTTNPRFVPAEELSELARGLSSLPIVVCRDPIAAWEEARAAAGPQELICVTGSFYIAAESRGHLLQRPVVAAQM